MSKSDIAPKIKTTAPMASTPAEQAIREQMLKAPAGTYNAKELLDRPAQIIKRYGGDPESLREMGIELKEPEPTQRFNDSFLDLKKTQGAYERFSQLLYDEKNPDYEDKTLGETIAEISNDKKIFHNLKTEEKQAAIDSTISDYEQIAKNKLTNEFPVLLHEIDVQAKNSDRNFNFIPTT